MTNPVRIYVLHHPHSTLAKDLTHRIYDWFRLPSLEGIPVYVRSAPEVGQDRPALPLRRPGQQCLEYIVPLVDAHLVRDPVWHEYLKEIVRTAAQQHEEPSAEWGWQVFPVALDSTAFNLPEAVARMNFIRYGVEKSPQPESSDKSGEQEQQALAAEELLKHLTEALARDLNTRLFQVQAERFKIFISYARADGTQVPKTLRNYIQGQTQCLVFFDENDIGYGKFFDESIANNVNDHARAMIVVNGDHYAERPWCRWEIEQFSQPRCLALAGSAGGAPGTLNVFQPVLVVNTMEGVRTTRVVPELAQAPTIRWAPHRERLCFSTLMREVVFGLRGVMAGRAMPPATLSRGIVVNRLPGPVAINRLLEGKGANPKSREKTVHHPGHGLPLVELRLLEKTFPRVRFRAFRDIDQDLPKPMADSLSRLAGQKAAQPLKGKVIALSTAYHEADLAALGYLPQHQDEALIHLLRPLVRLGADLLYGGGPPQREIHTAPSPDPNTTRNITLTLLQLLSDEQQVVEIDPSEKPGSMLFNISVWPRCERIQPADEAAWIKTCRVRKVLPADANLPPWTGPIPDKSEVPPQNFRRVVALTYSRMREMLAEGFSCPIPGDLKRQVKPAAFVFMGGALEGFKSIMPGIMEEFLRAAQARPAIPIFLMGGLGGATGVVARALREMNDAPRPVELSQSHYQGRQAPYGAEYEALLADLQKSEAEKAKQEFEDLWNLIHQRRSQGNLENLFSNGLGHEDNLTLLETANTIQAVHLIWKGMSQVFLKQTAPLVHPSRTTVKAASRFSRRSIRK